MSSTLDVTIRKDIAVEVKWRGVALQIRTGILVFDVWFYQQNVRSLHASVLVSFVASHVFLWPLDGTRTNRFFDSEIRDE